MSVAYYNRIMVTMFSNVIRTLCVLAFIGVLLMTWVINALVQNNIKNDSPHGILRYKTVKQRKMRMKQVYTPNVIYLGDSEQQGSNTIQLRSRIR